MLNAFAEIYLILFQKHFVLNCGLTSTMATEDNMKVISWKISFILTLKKQPKCVCGKPPRGFHIEQRRKLKQKKLYAYMFLSLFQYLWFKKNLFLYNSVLIK